MDNRLQKLERVFRALGDPTRLRIIGLLAGGEICVCHIHEALRIPQPKTSRHLAYLRRAGLVDARKEGLWVHYRLAQPADPTVRTVLSAAVHTLTHVATARTDRSRLGKRGIRTAIEEHMLPVVACCAAAAEGSR
jgi:ArsR family transcriptional regulator, arsenate/arsenite/antimonite-responsive transcriptional repressor